MTEELYAVADKRLMGRIIWDRRRDRLRFIYEEEWFRSKVQTNVTPQKNPNLRENSNLT